MRLVSPSSWFVSIARRLAAGALVSGLLPALHPLAAETLPKESPFVPPAGAASSEGAPAQPYELVGMTRLGTATLVGIVRQQDRQSFWIPVGSTANGISVMRYDAERDEATIRAGSQVLTLRMRTASVAPAPAAAIASSPAPAPLPAALPPGVPSRPMSTQEQKEMEARMLVSDLLEIGQQQRKAYEEAQRQAARAKAAANAAKPRQTSAPANSQPAR